MGGRPTSSYVPGKRTLWEGRHVMAAPLKADRDPTKVCSEEGCGSYKAEGLTSCPLHTPGSLIKREQRSRAKREVERAALALQEGQNDHTLPVRPGDFRRICAEYVGRFNRVFANLEAELDVIRTGGTLGGIPVDQLTEIELARAYGDIMDRQAASAILVTKMIQAAAALGVDVDHLPNPAEQVEDLLRSLREVHERSQVI